MPRMRRVRGTFSSNVSRLRPPRRRAAQELSRNRMPRAFRKNTHRTCRTPVFKIRLVLVFLFERTLVARLLSLPVCLLQHYCRCWRHVREIWTGRRRGLRWFGRFGFILAYHRLPPLYTRALPVYSSQTVEMAIVMRPAVAKRSAFLYLSCFMNKTVSFVSIDLSRAFIIATLTQSGDCFQVAGSSKNALSITS